MKIADLKTDAATKIADLKTNAATKISDMEWVNTALLVAQRMKAIHPLDGKEL
jgi:hypothetical protein